MAFFKDHTGDIPPLKKKFRFLWGNGSATTKKVVPTLLSVNGQEKAILLRSFSLFFEDFATFMNHHMDDNGWARLIKGQLISKHLIYHSILWYI